MVAEGWQPASGGWLVMLNDSDQAGALGYHDLTSDGLPLGKHLCRQRGLAPASGERVHLTGGPSLLQRRILTRTQQRRETLRTISSDARPEDGTDREHG